MLQRSIRRLAIAAALLSLLTLTPPLHAVGWGSVVPGGDFFKAAQQWVAGFLGRAVGVGEKPRGVKADRGSGVDPDGAPLVSTVPSCQGNCGARSGSNPNG
jgi:hypothetical protein